jgi:hypothetical protein
MGLAPDGKADGLPVVDVAEGLGLAVGAAVAAGVVEAAGLEGVLAL